MANKYTVMKYDRRSMGRSSYLASAAPHSESLDFLWPAGFPICSLLSNHRSTMPRAATLANKRCRRTAEYMDCTAYLFIAPCESALLMHLHIHGAPRPGHMS